jgi:hypothetical protein
MADTDGGGDKEESTINKSGEILRPGSKKGPAVAADGSVNVMNIKTREFRYNSVKKNEGKVMPHAVEDVDDLP